MLLLCAALLAAFLAQGWWFIVANSQTHDEAVHLTAGYSYLATHEFRLNPEHPPLLKEWAAVPLYLGPHPPFRPAPNLWEQKPEAEKWGISRQFLYHSGVPHDELLDLGRLPGLVLGGLLVALVGWWSYRLWGAKAALLGTALAAFEPNLVTNACLITTDLGSALFIVLTMYLLWEYGNNRSPLLLVAAGVTTGLALASKLTGILLFGMGGVILAAHVLLHDSPLFPSPALGAGKGARLRQAVVIAVAVAGLAAVTILPFYFFQGWGTWLYGFQWQTSKGAYGHPAFFLGQYSDKGWLLYFPVAFLLKTPLPTLLLIAASLLLFRAGTPLRLRDALFLLVPVGVFLALMVPAKINIGVRYLTPVYPFLFVAASRLATLRFPRPWLAPVLLGGPVLLTAASSLWQAPHYLAYFNELTRGPGYDTSDRCLADTNIDWGQDLKGLKEYMDREGVPVVYLSYFGTAPPEEYGVRYQEMPSFGAVDWPAREVKRVPADEPRKLLAVSVTNLQGAYLGEPGPYEFFYHHRTPRAKIGWSIWVYDLTGDTEALGHLTDVYRYAAVRERKVAAQFEAKGMSQVAELHQQVARQWDELAEE